MLSSFFPMKKISKVEATKQIKEFFENLSDKTPKDVKKIKRLAMQHRIPLKERRKLFCKVCYNPYHHPSIRIKKDVLRMICDSCENVSRWKVK